jgi:hypothetical protein
MIRSASESRDYRTRHNAIESPQSAAQMLQVEDLARVAIETHRMRSISHAPTHSCLVTACFVSELMVYSLLEGAPLGVDDERASALGLRRPDPHHRQCAIGMWSQPDESVDSVVFD